MEPLRPRLRDETLQTLRDWLKFGTWWKSHYVDDARRLTFLDQLRLDLETLNWERQNIIDLVNEEFELLGRSGEGVRMTADLERWVDEMIVAEDFVAFAIRRGTLTSVSPYLSGT